MKILVTNDDGIESAGLRALVDALKGDHEVWVMAPDGERSGSSLAISLHGALRVRALSDRVFACAGTPGDCVLLACLGAIPVKPDLVLSGINHGPNLGTDIIYSGTVGAARQAALMGFPGVAISVAGTRAPFHFGPAVAFVRRNIEAFVSMWTSDHFLNVNVPNCDGENLPYRLTQPSRRVYRDKLDSFTAPNRDIYYVLNGDGAESVEGTQTDWAAVSGGEISVSPVSLHPQNWSGEAAYGKVLR